MEDSREEVAITEMNFVPMTEYKDLMEWNKILEEGKDFLENENKKMSEWIKKVEADKEELIREQQGLLMKISELESLIKENQEKSIDNKQKIAELENEKSKLNYKINKYLSNPKIKKIVESKKLDEF